MPTNIDTEQMMSYTVPIYYALVDPEAMYHHKYLKLVESKYNDDANNLKVLNSDEILKRAFLELFIFRNLYFKHSLFRHYDMTSPYSYELLVKNIKQALRAFLISFTLALIDHPQLKK